MSRKLFLTNNQETDHKPFIGLLLIERNRKTNEEYYGKPNKNGNQKPLQIVYVLNKHGEPLHPTTRCWRVRKLLESGKAVVVNNNPFTIRLKYEVQGEVQPVILGIDPGRENIGLCAVDD